MSRLRACLLMFLLGCCGLANAQTETESVVLPAGTRILLTLVNSLNSKKAKVGEVAHFRTLFPVAVDNRLVIPVGSHVQGEVAQVHRPGRLKGKGKIAIRFTKLTLPNGAQQTISASLIGLDASNPGKKSEEGGVQAASGGEAKKVAGAVVEIVAEGAAEGVMKADLYAVPLGVVVGTATAVLGTGLSMLVRGPDVNLPSGTHLEIRLAQEIFFSPAELEIPAQ